MSKLFYLFIAVYFPLSSMAAPLSTNEANEFVTKIERMREALKISAGKMQECNPQSPEACSFEGYCGKLVSRAQDAYLYQDSEGHQIPNFTYLFLAEEAELCERKAKPLLKDPFVYPEMFVNATDAGGADQLKKNQKLLADATTRSQKLAQETRSLVVNFLNRRKNGKNNAQIKNLIERVQSVKMDVVAPANLAEMASHGCELPNAAYDLSKHAIKICPQILNMPDASIIATLAHELGHSFDPCSASLDFAKDGAKFPSWMETPVMGSNSPTEFEKLSTKTNPFAEVISCLQEPSSIGVKIPTQKQLIDEVGKMQDYLGGEERVSQDQENGEDDSGAEIGQRDAAAAKLEDRMALLKDHYEDHKGCSAVTGSGLIDEAFADWVSSQVIADKISTLPTDKASEFAFASAGIFYGTSCSEIANQSFDKMTAMMPKCQTILKFKDFGKENPTDTDHPPAAQRVNRIFLAKPEIKKALACQGGETGTPCE